MVASLGGRFRRGLLLSLLNTVLARAATFAMGIVLARFLSPEQYGMFATALTMQMFLLVVNDLGVGAALVRSDRPVQEMLPTCWTLSVGGGLVCTLAAVAGSGVMASALGSPNATGILQLMSLNILINGFVSVPASLLKRNFEQGKRLIADLVGLTVNISLTLSLVAAGFGAWSLAIGHVTGAALVGVLIMVATRCWPRFGFDRGYGRQVAQLGLAMAGAAVLLICLQAAPQAITGHLLGPTAIGFFFIASNVANWPIQIVSTTVERVALATFAQARTDGRSLEETASAVIGLVVGIVLISGTALAVLAHPIIGVVYGRPWLPAASMLAGLALANVARVLAELVFNLLVAADSMLTSMLPQAAWLAVLVPASILGGRLWGMPGIGWAQAAVGFAWAVPVNLWCARKAGVGVRSLLRGLGGPVRVTLVLAVVLVGLSEVSPHDLVTLAVGLPVAGAAVLFTYRNIRGTLSFGQATQGSTAPTEVTT
ncbi:MAG: oligosaccharide flippase family protein [Streptosporangiaceae bacterium]